MGGRGSCRWTSQARRIVIARSRRGRHNRNRLQHGLESDRGQLNQHLRRSRRIRRQPIQQTGVVLGMIPARVFRGLSPVRMLCATAVAVLQVVLMKMAERRLRERHKQRHRQSEMERVPQTLQVYPLR